MAYTKKTWVKGSTPLSAENFNHMEQGIADAHTEITQLNSDMERTDFNITFLNSDYNFYGKSYEENGKVYINGNFHCISPSVGIKTCAFIPEGFRPTISTGSAAYTDDDVNFNNIGGIKIDKTGDITLYFPTEYSRRLYVSIVYDC